MTAGAAIAKYSDNKSQTSPLGTSSLFALWLLISLACLTCIILIFTPTYRSNDDVLSTMLYSGKLIIDQPTPDYWVSNILFGRSISKLYTHFPKIPWYSFAIYACYLIPLALVGLVSTLKGLNRFAIGTLVIWLVICVLPLTTQPQFTTASTFACGIGMYSIIWILCCSNLPTYQLRIVLIASMLTIILGSCIRAEGLILGGIPNVLFLVHLWYSGKTDLRKLCQWLGATFTVCLALYLIDYMHFRLQPEWRDFMQFRDAATRVIDAGDTKFMDRAVIAAKGWSKEELELLRDHWFMVDPDIVSQQHLENLLSATPGMLSKVVSNLSSNETYLRLKGELFRELPYLICFICLAACLAGRKCFGRFLLIVIGCGLSIVLIAAAWKAPWRLIYGMLAIVPLYLLVDSNSDSLVCNMPKTVRHVVTVALIAFATFAALDFLYETDRYAEQRRANVSTTFEQFSKLANKSNKPIVVWGRDLPFEHLVLPFEELRSVPNVPLIWICLVTRTPFSSAWLERLGVKDLLAAIVDNQLSVIVLPERLHLIQWHYEHVRKKPITPTLEGKTDQFSVFHFATK